MLIFADWPKIGAFDEDGGAIEPVDGPDGELRPGKPVTTGANIFNIISDNHVKGKSALTVIP